MLFAGGLARGDDARRHLGQRAGDADLGLHPRIGRPPDRDAGGIEALERATAVEHHHHGVGGGRPTVVAQAASGGDHERRADLVQGDAVAGRQRLDRGDARNDAQVEQHLSAQPFDNAQSAVIERGVAPDQEARLAAVGQGLAQGAHPGLGDRVMPIIDPLPIIGRGLVADRQIELMQARPWCAQVAGADLAAEFREVFLVGAFARDQQRVDLVHRRDGLLREVSRVAGADADQDQREAHSVPLGKRGAAPVGRKRRS